MIHGVMNGVASALGLQGSPISFSEEGNERVFCYEVPKVTHGEFCDLSLQPAPGYKPKLFNSSPRGAGRTRNSLRYRHQTQPVPQHTPLPARAHTNYMLIFLQNHHL